MSVFRSFPARRRIILALGPVFLLSGPALAQDAATIALTLKDHRFTPSEIHIAAHTPAVLTIKNEDELVEEFDSTALKIEKVVAGGTYGTVRLRPLGAGQYPFMGEYHADTAQGVVIADPSP